MDWMADQRLDMLTGSKYTDRLVIGRQARWNYGDRRRDKLIGTVIG
jgi:hypothetical protein